MFNLYKLSKESNYRIIKYDNVLYVEYKCIPGASVIDTLWSPQGHFVYVTSGSKTWITPNGEIHADQGEAVYCKSGACVMKNFYETDFCALILFFPVEFVKEVVFEFKLNISNNSSSNEKFDDKTHAYKINLDHSLKIFLESISTFFYLENSTTQQLIKLKFKEFVLQILSTNSNPELKNYFISTLDNTKENIEAVLRKNLLFNLCLQDYADLCNRSLSSFKKDFKNLFQVSPLQWIIKERLKYARIKLETTDDQVNDVAFYSGFESTSHFIRSFKKQYGLPPNQFRNSLKK